MKNFAGYFMGILISVFMLAVANPAMAQDKAKDVKTAPPSYKGDPDVYKVIFEDQHFRVIEAVRKKGVHDKAHGHPLPSISYSLTDCTTKNYAADGTVRDNTSKAGTARTTNVVASHSVETTGTADCRFILVERK